MDSSAGLLSLSMFLRFIQVVCINHLFLLLSCIPLFEYIKNLFTYLVTNTSVVSSLRLS